MTVIGIGGCMGLILVGFGLQDSITAIAKTSSSASSPIRRMLC